MELSKKQQAQTSQEEQRLLEMLDKGIDDMEAGRELSVDEAFRKIAER